MQAMSSNSKTRLVASHTQLKGFRSPGRDLSQEPCIAGQPLTFLSSFSAFGQEKVSIRILTSPVSGQSAQVSQDTLLCSLSLGQR